MKTGDVILVALDGVEGERKRHICEAGMNAILLIDWHLVLFEVEVGDALLEHTNQQVVGKLVLISKARGWDRLKPLEEVLVSFMPLSDSLERVVGELVIV